MDKRATKEANYAPARAFYTISQKNDYLLEDKIFFSNETEKIVDKDQGTWSNFLIYIRDIKEYAKEKNKKGKISHFVIHNYSDNQMLGVKIKFIDFKRHTETIYINKLGPDEIIQIILAPTVNSILSNKVGNINVKLSKIIVMYTTKKGETIQKVFNEELKLINENKSNLENIKSEYNLGNFTESMGYPF